MQKIILLIFWTLNILEVTAQNLIVNPGAESLPRGTGWTIVSQGAAACVPIPTNNYINWTLIPDGTANYPYDHTITAAGGTIFFAGCSAAFGGPFELQQIIDVSADAANIDAGSQLYTFSGYMQTPVSNQTDQGRFIIDYLNAANAILGTSYTSSWQSYFGGSGNQWIFYTNTRVAPAGTRKLRVRLQAQLFFNQYAVNVYFDDISITKPTVVPVILISFTGNEVQGNIYVKWKTSSELNFKQYELEKSADGTNFNVIAVIPGGNMTYSFTDDNNGYISNRYFYRLKMADKNGNISYSKIIIVNTTDQQGLLLSPNPASNTVTVSGLSKKGNLAIINAGSSSVFTAMVNAPAISINISRLAAGVYIVRYTDSKKILIKKLIVQ